MQSFLLSEREHESIDAGRLHQRTQFVESCKATQFERCARGAVVARRAAFRLPTNRIIWLRHSFGCDAAGRLAKTLDPLLDVSERPEAGFDCVGGDVLQNI
jgi:hypothetical protein